MMTERNYKMKNVLIITLLITLMGCSRAKSPIGETSEPVTISGIIRNYSPGLNSRQITAEFYEYGTGNFITYISDIKNDCSFTIKLKLYLPQTIWLDYNQRFDVIIHPGDSLFIEIDASKINDIDFLNSLIFHGNTSKSNRNLCEYLISLNNKHPHYGSDIIDTLSPNIYKAKWDSIRSCLLEHRKKFIKENKPTKEVKIWTIYNIETIYLNSLLIYSVTRQRFYPERKRVVWDLPVDYFDFIENVPEINMQSLVNPGITGFINIYKNNYLFTKIYNENIEKNPNASSDSMMISEIIKMKEGNLFSQLLLTEQFSKKLDLYSIPGFELYLDTINKYITEPFLKEPLINYYTKRKNSYENPELISKTIETVEDTDGSVDILKRIVNDNMGKVIYIDCFGTWCPPCLKELPESSKLIKRYETKEISFVFLCFSSEKQRYDAIISDLELKGQHYFLNEQQSQTLSSILKISGFPHYLLIDKNGKLIQDGSHLRPSNQSTITLIDKLLAE
jgi:thiol-disulfide isomerase/thioredoxin